MASKKKTESQLDTYRIELAAFEDLVRRQERLNSELKAIGGLIESKRKNLMLSAVTPSRLVGANASSKKEVPALEGQDPRVRRSLREVFGVMQKHGGSIKSAELAKALGISTKAAQLRLYRARKLGLVRAVSPGHYAWKA